MTRSTLGHAIPQEGLTVFSGMLAVVSTVIGGGIVGIPFAFLNFGIPLATVVCILIIVATNETIRLYLAAKDRIPDMPESLYEIGYMLFGRAAIIFIAATLAVTSLGVCMIYFITFGDTTA